MASGETSTVVQCPECKEPIVIPLRLRHVTPTQVALSFNLAPVREHIASHQARFTTELPPTARR